MRTSANKCTGGLVKRGDWAVRHSTVPDLAIGEQHGDDADGRDGNGLGEERWGQPLRKIEEGDEYGQLGRAGV